MLSVLICCMSGGTYSLKSTPNDRFLRSFSRQLLFTLRAFARNLLRGNRRRNTLCILSWSLAFVTIYCFRFLQSNKLTHYLLEYVHFSGINFLHFSLRVVTFPFKYLSTKDNVNIFGVFLMYFFRLPCTVFLLLL